MITQYRTWHIMIVVEQIKWPDDVKPGIPSSPLDITRSDYIGRGNPSWSLGSNHARKTSGVACQHRPWTAHEER